MVGPFPRLNYPDSYSILMNSLLFDFQLKTVQEVRVMQMDKKVLSRQIRSRLSQPCPSSLSGNDRAGWQRYRASLRHLGSQVDNHQGPIRKEHLVGFGSHLGAITQGTATPEQNSASPAVPGASALGNAMGGSAGSVSGQSGTVGSMATTDMRFLDLQNMVQKESRQFQTLSRVLKARRDVASSAVRNTRA
jgi:hypothetical protein